MNQQLYTTIVGAEREKIFNFRASRLPETDISRVFVKKKYSTSEKNI